MAVANHYYQIPSAAETICSSYYKGTRLTLIEGMDAIKTQGHQESWPIHSGRHCIKIIDRFKYNGYE